MNNSNPEAYASHRLNYIRGLSPVDTVRLISHFGSAVSVIQAGIPAWDQAHVEGLNSAECLENYRSSEKEANDDWELILKENIKVFLLHASPYPARLGESSSAPTILYVRGDDVSKDQMSIALVGSRRCSYYGIKMARELSGSLARLGIVTVSGLARGIDSAVHEETLKEKGRTWAVLGCGLNRCYPPENKNLYKKISENGAVISEFPLNMAPYPGNFPRRNRIIAGISYGTVVVEGAEKSGSLITARLAVEEGREVFAVPGPVTSDLSSASHLLIQQGAKLVRHAGDIIEELPDPWQQVWKDFKNPGVGINLALPASIQSVFGYLNERPFSKEELALKLNMSGPEISSLIFEMEIKGLIKLLPGGILVRS